MNRRILLAIVLVLLGSLFFLYELLYAPNTFEGDRFITVSKGENFSQVVDSLSSTGVIRNRTLFVLAGELLKLTKKMQIGKYRFKSGMSNREILQDLRTGKSVELVIVAIPEGMKAARQARLLARMVGIDSSRFMQLVNDSVFAKDLGAGANTLEGYLMPKTYKLYWQTDEEDILVQMVYEFRKVFNDSLKRHADSLGMSVNDVLTLASIIEAETAVDSERAIIAGVYYNRLKRNMRLEADPTIQYIIPDGPRRLTYSDLWRESPYNTYRHYGLPPTPINNPGEASIHAALHPRKHKYLYFVATGLGGHAFTRSFDEHQRAAKRYRKIREEQQAMKEEG